MMQDDQPSEVEAGGRPRLLIGGVEGADPQVKADLVLDADVAVAPPKAGKQHVKIVWRLRRKDGGEIGTVGQENDVPTGLLDGPWSDVAYIVAAAAQDGIMQLVARGIPQSAGKS